MPWLEAIDLETYPERSVVPDLQYMATSRQLCMMRVTAHLLRRAD